MRIIDFHTHIYPDKIAYKATKATEKFYDVPTKLIGTEEILLEKGKEAGISEFVLLPVATSPHQVRTINDYSFYEMEKVKEFYAFGSVHAELEDIEEETSHILDLGLMGVKLHPDIQGFNIDDERLFPMYDMISGKIPVIFHTGDFRYDYSHPRRIKRLMEMFPSLQVIAAHFGGWSIYEDAVEYLKDTSCYLDISSAIMYTGVEKARELINEYGIDRILFGSDFPMWNPVEEVERFYKLNLSLENMEKIAYKNALRILKKN